MDEFLRILAAFVTGGLLPVAVGFLDLKLLANLKDKRNFRNQRRDKAYAEIEDLKDKVGELYELSTNLKAYEVKREDYDKIFESDHRLIGKYNKYPEIATAARDTVHSCKNVAVNERDQDKRGDLIQQKRELSEKYLAFIQACDKYIESLIQEKPKSQEFSNY